MAYLCFVGIQKQDSFAYRSYEDRASFENSPYGINPKIASLIEEDFNKEWFRRKFLCL